MKFDEFLTLIPKIKKLPLPGTPAHHKMAPLERIKSLTPEKIAFYNPREAAVMALYYPNNKGLTTMALILRKTYKGVHSNQIGFPGGKVESSDKDLEDTALRETHEEVGVHPSLVKVVTPLTKVYIPPSNFWVYSFIGYTLKRPGFILQEEEVEALVEISVADLLNPDAVIMKSLSTSYMSDAEVPAFLLNDYVVWGATAMILSEIKDLLLQA